MLTYLVNILKRPPLLRPALAIAFGILSSLDSQDVQYARERDFDDVDLPM